MFCSHPGGRGPPGQNHGVNRNSKENGFTTALGRFCTFWPGGRVVTWHGLKVCKPSKSGSNSVGPNGPIVKKAGGGPCEGRRNYYRFRKVLHPRASACCHQSGCQAHWQTCENPHRDTSSSVGFQTIKEFDLNNGTKASNGLKIQISGRKNVVHLWMSTLCRRRSIVKGRGIGYADHCVLHK